jgi:hypothetical protein
MIGRVTSKFPASGRPHPSSRKASSLGALETQMTERNFMRGSARGWVLTAQRTGRYSYRKVMAHVTNPDHLEPSPAPSGPPLRIAPRYAGGRPR